MVTVKESQNSALAVREAYLTQRSQRMAALLPAGAKSGFSIEAQIRSFQIECDRNPDLLKCAPETIAMSYYVLTAVGLVVGSTLGHAYIIPRWNSKKNQLECTPLVGYRGMIYAARRSGAARSIYAEVARKGDLFRVRRGTNPGIDHEPAYIDGAEPTHYYAVAVIDEHTTQFIVMSAAQIDQVRVRATTSKDGKERFSPWKTDYEEMGKKTVIRRLAKHLALSNDEQRRSFGLVNAIEEVRDELGGSVVDVARAVEIPVDVVRSESGEVDEPQPEATLRTVVTGEAEPTKEAEIIDVEHDARKPLPSYDDGSAPADVTTGKATIAKYLNDKSYQKLAHGVVTAHREATKRALTEFTIEDVAAVLGEIRKAVRG